MSGSTGITAPGFAVEVDHAPHLGPDGTRVDAIVSVTGPDRPSTPIGTVQVLVIDCSGSMIGDKIEQARRATAAAVAALPDGTLFAVVAGTSRAAAVYPDAGAARADARTRSEAAAAVRTLQAGGGTRLGVWLDAARAVAECFPDAVRHTLLVTDGRNAESTGELHDALERCRGVFTCDCRGIGIDWDVAELRTIATALLGGVDIVADAADLGADVARVLGEAAHRSVAGVAMRLWTPQDACVHSVVQVAPEVRELVCEVTGPNETVVALGDWGPETREYHVRVDVPARPVGDRMLVARVGVADDLAADVPVVVTRTAQPCPVAARLAHYAAQVELAGAVRDGLAARRDGDAPTATLLLGRARSLAERTGHHDTLSLLDGVVVDTGDGVALRPDATVVDEMTLDARGRRSVPADRRQRH